MNAVRKLAGWYLQSWPVLLWSTLCVCIGAAWAFIAIIGVLETQGIL